MQWIGFNDDENIHGYAFDFTYSDNVDALVEYMKTRYHMDKTRRFSVLYASRLLEKIPPVFLEFQNITLLDFSQNRLRNIPLDIHLLVNLKKLELQYNLLVDVPYTIGKCQNLEVLNLSFNHGLCKLPPTLGDCKNLHMLYLQHTVVIKHFSFNWFCAVDIKHFQRDLKAAFSYREARAATVALLALSKRKPSVLPLHKDVVRNMIAPMLYETRHLDDEIWR